MAHKNANTQTQAVRLVFAKGTDVGRKRGHNEDYVDAFRPSDPHKHRQKGELFIVADGMGGHQAGEVASEKAVEAISHEYYAGPVGDVRDALVDAIERANALIYRLAQESPSRAGMGTTAVAAIVRGQELYLANVGDSRAYLLRNGKLTQVTRDHSFVQDQIEAGILTPEEARTHPQRNVVTRALGSRPDVKVDAFGGQLQSGDILLLCSDGLSEHVPDDDIAALLRQHPPKEAVPRLIALANSRGGSDNITALVIQMGSPAGTTAMAGAASSEQAAPTVPSKPAKADQGLSLALVAGLTAGGLIVVAALIVGFFVGPRFLWRGGKETPQPSVQSVLLTPTPMSPSPTRPPATATLMSPSQSSTPRGTSEGLIIQPTSTPRVDVSLIEPEDGEVVRPGAEVTFRWQIDGDPSGPITFSLRTDRSGYEDLYEGGDTSFRVSLPTGQYHWWVAWSSEDRTKPADERRTLYVVLPSTATDTPTSTPTPLPPTDAPRPSGGEGGSDGDDRPKTKTPAAEPTTPVAEPTNSSTPEPVVP